MAKLFLLVLVGGIAYGAYNYSAIKHTVRDTVQGTVRDSVNSVARETKDTVREARTEIKEHASEGVHNAVNRTEEAVTSATVTSKIKAKMALDDLVKASNINVDTEGRVVTLTGTVASKDEQRRALRIATETAGVTKVVNHLKVR